MKFKDMCARDASTRRASNTNMFTVLGVRRIDAMRGHVTSRHVTSRLEFQEAKEESKRSKHKWAHDASTRSVLNANMVTAFGARRDAWEHPFTSRNVTS